MINHHIVGLHISVHDSIGMAEVQSFQQLEDVVADIIIGQSWVQRFEICVVDVFENQGWSLRLSIQNNIEQLNDVCSTTKILQNLDFALDLLLLHRLQDFDNAFLTLNDIHTSKDFTVLSSANLLHYFVVILISEVQLEKR